MAIERDRKLYAISGQWAKSKTFSRNRDCTATSPKQMIKTDKNMRFILKKSFRC